MDHYEGQPKPLFMTAAIFFHPEAYSTTGPKLMGRNTAGESFLRGFLNHTSSRTVWARSDEERHKAGFEKLVADLGYPGPVAHISRRDLFTLKTPGTLFVPGPAIADFSHERSPVGHQSWSLCGITHTTSSKTAMDAVSSIVTAPIQSWDALICTSAAVRANVEYLLDNQVSYLKDRLGLQWYIKPQLPVIPLGVHTADFIFEVDEKVTARDALGIAADTVVVLFIGRLSFHAKAHPLAMYVALQKTAEATGKKITLVECGWHGNEHIATAFADAAKHAMHSVNVIVLDGRCSENRRLAWATADIFCSLSDNIQETFGITPVEAMAAGLPVVVSDWDGYRDTVRHDVDGFLCPTIMPGAGLGGDLAYRHAIGLDSYDIYCGLTSMLVAVDIEFAANALVRLVQNPDLRKSMGENGRRRAKDIYDWSNIIPQYEEVWAQLAELRIAAPAAAPTVWAARPDPFASFGQYPTSRLTSDVNLSLTFSNVTEAVDFTESARRLSMINFAHYVLLSPDEVRAVLAKASRHPTPAGKLTENIPADRRVQVFRGLAWLIKLGVLRVVL